MLEIKTNKEENENSDNNNIKHSNNFNSADRTYFVMGEKVVIGNNKYDYLIGKGVVSKNFGNGIIVNYTTSKIEDEELVKIEVEFTRQNDSKFYIKYDLNSGMALNGIIAGMTDLTIPEDLLPSQETIIL